MRIFVKILLLFSWFACTLFANEVHEKEYMNSDKLMAISVANTNMLNDGLDIGLLKITYVEKATEDSFKYDKFSKDFYQKHIRPYLIGRTFWFIYYAPLKTQAGGGRGYFIDASSFEVLFIYRSK